MLKSGSFPTHSVYRRSGIRAMTLLEMMIVLGLTSMLVSIISYANMNMSRSVRQSEAKAERRAKLIAVAERLRWQLRFLYVPQFSSDNSAKPPSNIHPGSLKYALYGKRSGEVDHDILIFNTTYLPKGHGTAEVGYRIMADQRTRRTYLAYRQLPWSDPLGLHEPDGQCDATWGELSADIVGMQVEFSNDDEMWQKEWLDSNPPPWVRVTLTPVEGEPIVLTVTPAVTSSRW